MGMGSRLHLSFGPLPDLKLTLTIGNRHSRLLISQQEGPVIWVHPHRPDSLIEQSPLSRP